MGMVSGHTYGAAKEVGQGFQPDVFLMAREVTSRRDGKLASTTELIDFHVASPSEGAFTKP
jgi:hypothetical protein